jgi:hypothetical protein
MYYNKNTCQGIRIEDKDRRQGQGNVYRSANGKRSVWGSACKAVGSPTKLILWIMNYGGLITNTTHRHEKEHATVGSQNVYSHFWRLV